MSQAQSDNSSHVDQLEVLPFVFLPTLFPENIRFQFLEKLGSRYHDAGRPVHPYRQHVETQVDWVLVVVDSYVGYFAALEEEGIAVYLAEVLDQDQDFRVDEAEF